MNYAIVESGVVVNVVIWDGQTTWQPPSGANVVQIPDGAYVGIGSTYDGTNFGPPTQPPSIV
jgi:hypothetical protein